MATRQVNRSFNKSNVSANTNNNNDNNKYTLNNAFEI